MKYINIFLFFYLELIKKDIKPYPIHFELHTFGAAPDFIDSLTHILDELLA